MKIKFNLVAIGLNTLNNTLKSLHPWRRNTTTM